MSIRKSIAVLLMICLTLTALTGCKGNKAAETAAANAAAAWVSLDRTDVPASVTYTHYSSADSLNTSIPRPDDTVALVPMSGYAFFFPPVAGQGSAFSGLTLVFVGSTGKVISTLDYDKLVDTFNATGVTAYLDAANYVAALYVDAARNGTAIGKDERLGTWYTFSTAQIQNIIKK